MMRRALPAAALIALALAAPAAAEAELDWSGFARIGYARSDQAIVYDRFVDRNGTFRRDSIAGAQLDARFTPRWSAIMQATLAPVGQDDRLKRAELPWATLSYRAGNDLLLRVGKQRVPMFLNSENASVGGAYTLSRLPVEMYSVAPNADFVGLSASRGAELALGELTLDGYAGSGDLLYRNYYRDASAVTQGSGVGRAKAASRGLVLTLRRDEDVYRAGIHHFALDSAQQGSAGGVGTDIASSIVGIGASVGCGAGWRASGEAAWHAGGTLNSGYNSVSGYLTLERKLGAWAPYATLARLVSHAPDRALAPVFAAGAAPGAAPVMPAAEAGAMFGQSSAALGVAYTAGPHAKWKGEWMRVRGGAMDGMRPRLNLLSLSYNVTF